VIGFGVHVTDQTAFARHLGASISRYAEPDAVILEASAGSVTEAYCEALQAASVMPDLEALVLVREDAELTDARINDQVRRALAEPAVGVVGVGGALHVTSLCWWEAQTRGTLRVHADTTAYEPRDGDVHIVDDAVVALSPCAVRTLRLDPAVSYQRFGAAAELSVLARLAGLRVCVRDLAVSVPSPPPYTTIPGFWRDDAVFRRRWSSP
jgi:hypothetical protein